ncbi:hypothetical protein [Limnoglobus roseus]|uniref:Uncharacterized protein n=1 Tax=Limnoglobus roseus TaxID=2598579 RepID=A0A5C1AL48_9BACT|nr:hypothetical protein [Limnoglobus roseus]QEL19961.1 hypothetical protein PX52LOC_07044 [Limnoglobus roseus]
MNATQIDELAARAMVSLLSGPRGDEYVRTPDLLARHAYTVAEAMAEEKRRRDEADRDASSPQFGRAWAGEWAALPRRGEVLYTRR